MKPESCFFDNLIDLQHFCVGVVHLNNWFQKRCLLQFSRFDGKFRTCFSVLKLLGFHRLVLSWNATCWGLYFRVVRCFRDQYDSVVKQKGFQSLFCPKWFQAVRAPNTAEQRSWGAQCFVWEKRRQRELQWWQCFSLEVTCSARGICCKIWERVDENGAEVAWSLYFREQQLGLFFLCSQRLSALVRLSHKVRWTIASRFCCISHFKFNLMRDVDIDFASGSAKVLLEKEPFGPTWPAGVVVGAEGVRKKMSKGDPPWYDSRLMASLDDSKGRSHWVKDQETGRNFSLSSVGSHTSNRRFREFSL